MSVVIASSTSWLSGAVVALTASLIYYHLRVFSFWSSRKINGPRPYPIFGTNIYYFFETKVDLDLKWRRRYGHTYGIFEGYSPVLRTTDNELMKQIYIKQFDSFTDRNSKAVAHRNQRKWLLWSKGDLWANQRALISPMFTSARMRSMFQTMSKCVDNFLIMAESKISPPSKEEQPGALRGGGALLSKTELMALTLDVIASSFFGLKLDTHLDHANEFLRRAYQFGKFTVPRFICWCLVPTPVALLFNFDLVPYERFEYFDKLSGNIINERRKANGSGKETTKNSKQNITGQQQRPNDFIQALLGARIPEKYEKVFSQEDDNESHYNDQIKHDELERINEQQARKAKFFRQFGDEEIRGQMTFMFLAGFETTAATLGFCIYELAHQRDAQAELHAELLEKFSFTQVEYSHLLELKKLDAFVAEVLRLYSPTLNNNRLVTKREGVELPTEPPIFLPYNTGISTNPFVVQRDEDYFERPLEFDITRFYPENKHKIKTCTYMPFGVGPRHCAGTRFALMEIKLQLAKMLLKYSVSPGAQSQAYPARFKHHFVFLQLEHNDFILTPRLPNKCTTC